MEEGSCSSQKRGFKDTPLLFVFIYTLVPSNCCINAISHSLPYDMAVYKHAVIPYGRITAGLNEMNVNECDFAHIYIYIHNQKAY